jgi:hypothetical protein
MAVSVLSHDQTGLKRQTWPPGPGAEKGRLNWKLAGKSKGRNPFTRPRPNAIRISKVWIDYPDHNATVPGLFGTFELCPSLPHSPVVTFNKRVSQLPIASIVADSLDGHSVTLSFWKIALPMFIKTRARSRELSRANDFC